MNKKTLNFILQEGEGFKVEFKEGLSGIDKDIVAFANADGGRILLGVADEGKGKGPTSYYEPNDNGTIISKRSLYNT